MTLRWALPAAVLLMGAALPCAAEAGVTVTAAAKGYDIDITDSVSTTELLDAITSATGATIKGQPEEMTVNANHLRSTSLEGALRKLLPGAGFAVRFSADNAPAEIIFLTAKDGAAAQGPDDGSSTGADGNLDSGTDGAADEPPNP
ncbi:hypothetical protein [Aestuariivirga sp.]|uniref:hypothetical protein n=1 Tax=Aestuariivirga sp. TaxID=2650926 RepID=UPI00301B3D46